MDEATFLELSVALTGFEVFDLKATGQLHAYATKVNRSVEPAVLGEIVSAWVEARELSEEDRAAAIAAMTGEPVIGPPLKRIVMLWYTGSWYIEPPFNASTLSGQSYIQGLMWKAIGAHPMAAAPQGFGAWALAPPVEGA